jgi:hypothetical protein
MESKLLRAVRAKSNPKAKPALVVVHVKKADGMVGTVQGFNQKDVIRRASALQVAEWKKRKPATNPAWLRIPHGVKSIRVRRVAGRLRVEGRR